MNNDNLQTIIDSQAKEIAELKSKLPGAQMHMQNDEITSFYKRKYLEMFDSIYQNRLELIAEEIQNIEQDIEKYTKEEEKINLAEALSNENLQKQAEIEQELAKKYITLEETRFNYDTLVTSIQNEAIKLYMIYNDYLEKYRELTTEYEIETIDQDTYLFGLYDLIKDLNEKGYKASVGLLEKEKEVTSTLTEEETALLAIQQEIEITKQQLEKLKLELHEVTDAEKMKVAEELKISESRKRDFKTEIDALYQKKKNEHLKTIEDEVIRFGFLGYDSRMKASALEDQLILFKQELLDIDTATNKNYQRTKREKMLNAELEKLKVVDEEREKLENEYNYLKNIYNDVLKKIKEVEEYNSRLMNLIDTKEEYKCFLDLKNNYDTEKKEMVAEIKEKNKNYAMLQDKRRIAVCDPFSKTPLSEIDEEIMKAKSDLDQAVALYKEKENRYNELTNSSLNTRLLNLLKQKEKNEKSLENFYLQLQELKTIIDNKYDEIKNLKEELKEYSNILSQLEDLKHETNNQ